MSFIAGPAGTGARLPIPGLSIGMPFLAAEFGVAIVVAETRFVVRYRVMGRYLRLLRRPALGRDRGWCSAMGC
jgi:hypothetical protein